MRVIDPPPDAEEGSGRHVKKLIIRGKPEDPGFLSHLTPFHFHGFHKLLDELSNF